MAAIFIVFLLFVAYFLFAEWFRVQGEARWKAMTDEERLEAVAKWRSAG